VFLMGLFLLGVAKGDLDSIGEVDLALGQTVFRYTGKLCLAGN